MSPLKRRRYRASRSGAEVKGNFYKIRWYHVKQTSLEGFSSKDVFLFLGKEGER